MAAYKLLSIVYYNEFIAENLFTEDGNIWISLFKNFSKTYFFYFTQLLFKNNRIKLSILITFHWNGISLSIFYYSQYE